MIITNFVYVPMAMDSVGGPNPRRLAAATAMSTPGPGPVVEQMEGGRSTVYSQVLLVQANLFCILLP